MQVSTDLLLSQRTVTVKGPQPVAIYDDSTQPVGVRER